MTRQDRAERTRNAILDAAAHAFDERGFSGASLSEILSKAGVTKGALYFHFSSKEELATAIIDEQYNMEIPTVEDAKSALQGLIDMLHVFGQHLYSDIRVRASNRLVVEANFARPPSDNYQRWIAVVQEYLVAAQAAGDLRSEWEPAAVANWVAGTFLGIQTLSGVLTDRADIHARITDWWQFSLPGLVPPRRLSKFVPSGTIQLDTSAA